MDVDIKIQSMALVIIVNICQLLWPIKRNQYWPDLFELTSFQIIVILNNKNCVLT